MDKKIHDKSSNFFKKEGFYVILFVCLCIVATVAAISARNSRDAKSKPPVVENKQSENKEVALESKEETKSNIDNALQVKKNEQDNTANKNSVTVPKDGKDSAAVSKSVDTTFDKPVEGYLAREYTTETIYCDTLSTWRTKSGMDIKADLGKKVVAVLDGVVEKVDNDKTELGQYVIINHQNGLKSIYANLDEAALVKQGQKVTKGQQIGKVGKSAGNYSSEKYGDHLNFKVLKDNVEVDPSKYVKYTTASKN
ncbi:M23 family metallopeptidase [Desnuesiella massiliensis]|uniref:M23 family metallopeptidase n=1 Tax=Desnuesiella massiliensis TaxID=1650662 RepID=UPI0006E38463|nr:M23 family metallopeptidase [Desnuesiella massiliensis]